MGCFTLLFFIILTISKVTSFSCTGQLISDQASGDDVPIPQKVTILQYCYIDNCTIMRTDTGEELDISYTTDSLLVATPTDGHTSVMITRLDDELPCAVSTSEAPDLVGIATFSSILMLLVLVNGYVFVVHLMFKKLRTKIGKLLMLRSILIILMAVNLLVKVLMESSQAWNQLIACHFVSLFTAIFSNAQEVAATCILHCFAYILYRSNKLQRISEAESKSLYRWYVTYILATVSLVSFVTISYDIGINRGLHILPSGDCSSNNDFMDNITNIFTNVQKSAQVILFFIYLYYKHQLNKDVQSSTILRSQEKMLNKIAIAMGASVGISHLLYVLYVIFNWSTAYQLAFLLFIIQQGVIMSSFLYNKKMKALCKERFLQN